MNPFDTLIEPTAAQRIADEFDRRQRVMDERAKRIANLEAALLDIRTLAIKQAGQTDTVGDT